VNEQSLKPKPQWQYPGGKLREVGPEALSYSELLAIKGSLTESFL